MYKKLGEGAFGTIFSPALPNNGYNPTNKNVLKIYNAEKTYTNAVNIDKTIANKFPSLNIKTKTYKRQYTFKNLPKSIKNILKSRRKTQNKNPHKIQTNNNSLVYMVHTPYLGNSIEAISYMEDNDGDKIKNIDCFKLVEEIRKCLGIIKDIKDAGYIHDDIQPRNVMFNFNDNTMHIIDFDTFKEKNKYMKHLYNLPQGVFSTYFLFPIESAIMFETFDKENINDNINRIINMINTNNNPLYKKIFNLFRRINIFDYTQDQITTIINNIQTKLSENKIDVDQTINDIIINITLSEAESELITKLESKSFIINWIKLKHVIFDYIYPYMDLWGFGCSILLLCAKISQYKNDPHIEFLINLIQGTPPDDNDTKYILHHNINNRYTIEDAIDKCKEYIELQKNVVKKNSMINIPKNLSDNLSDNTKNIVYRILALFRIIKKIIDTNDITLFELKNKFNENAKLINIQKNTKDDYVKNYIIENIKNFDRQSFYSSLSLHNIVSQIIEKYKMELNLKITTYFNAEKEKLMKLCNHLNAIGEDYPTITDYIMKDNVNNFIEKCKEIYDITLLNKDIINYDKELSEIRDYRDTIINNIVYPKMVNDLTIYLIKYYDEIMTQCIEQCALIINIYKLNIEPVQNIGPVTKKLSFMNRLKARIRKGGNLKTKQLKTKQLKTTKNKTTKNN